MAAIQVKNVPPDLHDALRRRAADEGIDLQDYVLQVLRRDVALPTTREWLRRLRAQPTATDLPPAVDVLADERAARADRP